MESQPNKKVKDNSNKKVEVMNNLAGMVQSADIETIFDTIEGQQLCKGKYKIGRYLDQGQYGKNFKVTDTSNTTLPLVVKV